MTGGSPQLNDHDCSGRFPGHTTRAPSVGFELETNRILRDKIQSSISSPVRGEGYYCYGRSSRFASSGNLRRLTSRELRGSESIGERKCCGDIDRVVT